MSDNTAVVDAPAPAATKAAKPKKVAAKKAAPSSPGNGRAPRARKDGLRLPQIRILRVLVKGKALTRGKIVEAVSQGDKPTAVGYSLGPVSPDKFKQYEGECGYKSLLQLGFVRARVINVDGRNETIHEITGTGKTALRRAEAELKPK